MSHTNHRILSKEDGNFAAGILVKKGICLYGSIDHYSGSPEEVQGLVDDPDRLSHFFMCLDVPVEDPRGGMLVPQPDIWEGFEPLRGATFRPKRLYLDKTVVRQVIKNDAKNSVSHVQDVMNLSTAYSSHSQLKRSSMLVNQNENMKAAYEINQTLFISGINGEIAKVYLQQGKTANDEEFRSSDGDTVPSWRIQISATERASIDLAALKNLKVFMGNVTVFDCTNPFLIALGPIQEGFSLKHERRPNTELRFSVIEESLISLLREDRGLFFRRLLVTIFPREFVGLGPDVDTLEGRVTLKCVQLQLDQVQNYLKELGIEVKAGHGAGDGDSPVDA